MWATIAQTETKFFLWDFMSDDDILATSCLLFIN